MSFTLHACVIRAVCLSRCVICAACLSHCHIPAVQLCHSRCLPVARCYPHCLAGHTRPILMMYPEVSRCFNRHCCNTHMIGGSTAAAQQHSSTAVHSSCCRGSTDAALDSRCSTKEASRPHSAPLCLTLCRSDSHSVILLRQVFDEGSADGLAPPTGLRSRIIVRRHPRRHCSGTCQLH